MMAWGLGYFGMPHILVRFMAIRDENELTLSRRIAGTWVVISMGVAVFIGIVGHAVSAAGRALLDPVEDAFQKNVFPPCRDVRFALAQLGNNAGIFGGAALFFTQST